MILRVDILNKLSKISFFLFLMSLAGCGGSSKEEATHEYVLKIKSRKSQPIDPLPEVKLFAPFTFTVSDMRSPFKKVVAEVAPTVPSTEQTGTGLQPDMKRQKEELESFALDTLKMVGTLENEEGQWVLIQDNAGTVHRVTIGNYLGQNYGKIDEIKEEEIILTELVQDPQGIWRERQVALTITE